MISNDQVNIMIGMLVPNQLWLAWYPSGMLDTSYLNIIISYVGT